MKPLYLRTSFALYAIAILLLLYQIFFGVIPTPGEEYPMISKIAMGTMVMATIIRLVAVKMETRK